jgi:hypothetical protein
LYYLIVVLLLFVFPLASIITESATRGTPLGTALIAKWYVFWAVGWRLFLAGTRQVAQPRYTARVILGLQSDEPLVLVRELGFANLGIGLVGIVSLEVASWRLAAALAGGIFYLLAGLNHVLQPKRNRLETTAMVSDLLAALVLLGVCSGALLGR